MYGFAGTGKTALAQTIADFAEESHILGATFSFSRTSRQNDPAHLFPSIAYQLATRNSAYRYLLAAQIGADPDLPQKDMSTHFKKLIVEPLSVLRFSKKVLIIIDGLDECRGYSKQCQIINLISGAASSPVPLPISWMVCSRPMAHIMATFSDTDFTIDCWRLEIRIDDSEARRDIELIFQDEFKAMMEKHSIVPKEGKSWPTAEDEKKMIDAASELPVYAHTAVKFIDDPDVADPESRLQAVISFIDDCSGKSPMTKPLYYLDKLYERILDGVHHRSLHQALQLLRTSDLYPSIPILQLANLFSLSLNQFYAVMGQLRSVVDIPQPDEAFRDVLRFHVSFIEFLEDPARSGVLAFDDRLIHLEFAKVCFGTLGQITPRYAMGLAWVPTASEEISAFSVAHRILNYCATNVWDACLQLGDVVDPVLLNIIVNFRYPFLRFVKDKIPILLFRDWIEWLTKQVRLFDSIIRLS